MVPKIALLCGYAICFWLIQADRKWRRLSSPALWIPALWIAVLGSRPFTFWVGAGGGSSTEGSPVNIVFNGFLIVSAFCVLVRRSFDWGGFARRNKALLLIYLYFAFSSAWSELPLSSFKRIFNDFGCVLIALLFLTDSTPSKSIRLVFVRVAYFLFPLSIIFIRYYPDIGRISSRSGTQMLTGVTGHKNSLGELIFVFGLVILWDMLANRHDETGPRTRQEKSGRWAVFLIGIYLLFVSDSATSLVCFIAGSVLLLSKIYLRRLQNPMRFVSIAATIVLCALIGERVFGISATILGMLGRNATLTGRTEIWDAVKAADVNPIIGSGFRGFWETKAGVNIYEELNVNRLFTAHNGYLETYLNGGVIALGLLVIVLLSGGANVLSKFYRGDLMGEIGIPFWVIAIIFNNSESSFFILSPLWFMWLLVTIDCPRDAFGEIDQEFVVDNLDEPFVSAKTGNLRVSQNSCC